MGYSVEKEGEMRCRCSRFLACAVTLVLLLSLAATLVGCSGGGEARDAVAMAMKLPEDTQGFSFVDMKALRADTDTEGVYETFKDAVESQTEHLGISADDVDSMATGDSVTILAGRFDLGDVRKGMEGVNYVADEYKGVETWEGHLSIALVSRSCIAIGSDMASVKACIEVIEDDRDSLQDDANLQNLLGRLPSGMMVSFYSAGYEEDYEGLDTVGYSLVKKAADTMQVTAIYRFEDEGAASAAVDDIEKDMKDDRDGTAATNVAVTPEGQYVKATGEASIADMFGGPSGDTGQ